MFPRTFVRLGLALLLISPYLFWIARGPTPAAPPRWIVDVLPRVLAQSVASTLGALLLAFVLFRGLRHTKAGAAREASLLFPSALPPLFLAFALFGLFPRNVAFPFGLGAVVAAHALVYGGLGAVALARVDRARLGPASEAAWAMSVSEARFWTRIAFPLLRRELFTLAFFVFTACFTGFSLPLLLQGPATATLEVAMYDLIRTHGRWDQAFTLATVQTLALMAIAALSPRARAAPAVRARSSSAYPAHAAWAWLTLVPGLACVVGLSTSVLRGSVDVTRTVIEAWLTSASIGAGVGGVVLVLALLTAFVLPHPRFERVLLGFVAPGPVLAGFGVLIAFPTANELARVIAALAVLSFPPLYRWRMHAAFEALRGQWRVARTLGASHRAILFDITWPQAAPAILGSAGLAAVWATGDFALAGVLLEDATTLPGLVAERLAHYEWDGAYALLAPMVLTALALDQIFRALARRSAAEIH